MVVPKSKKIKKIKLDLEKQKIEVQQKTQKTKQSKIKIQLKTNRQHLTSSSCKLKRKMNTTKKLLLIDQSILQQALTSLKRFGSNAQLVSERRMFLNIQLLNKVHLNELKIENNTRPIRYGVNEKPKVLFIVNEAEADFKKVIDAAKLDVQYKIIDYSKVEKNQLEQFEKFMRQFTHRLVSSVIYKEFLKKHKFNKSQNMIGYPFHPTKIPADFAKLHNITAYKDYLKILINSVYVYLYQDKDYMIQVGSSQQSCDHLLDNVNKCIYNFVPHLMLHSKQNHVSKLSLSLSNSDKLQIYESIKSNNQ